MNKQASQRIAPGYVLEVEIDKAVAAPGSQVTHVARVTTTWNPRECDSTAHIAVSWKPKKRLKCSTPEAPVLWPEDNVWHKKWGRLGRIERYVELQTTFYAPRPNLRPATTVNIRTRATVAGKKASAPISDELT